MKQAYKSKDYEFLKYEPLLAKSFNRLDGIVAGLRKSWTMRNFSSF